MRTLIFLALVLVIGSCPTVNANTPEDFEFRRTVRSLLRIHCTKCHNEADKKAGINLDAFDFVVHVVRRGELFQKVIESVEHHKMPPPNKSRMTDADRDTMIAGIRKVLDKALLNPDPGPAVMRRLSHREYGYTIEDLLGVTFNGRDYFPTEASGGEGFDNQSGVLYLTPLLVERYYAAADSVLRATKKESALWKKIIPRNYRPSILRRGWNWLVGLTGQQKIYWQKPVTVAQRIILPFAMKAYRKPLTSEHENQLIDLFKKIYYQNWKKKKGFEIAVMATLKKVLISPNFLFRVEGNQPIHKPYAINNFELATRLSYLLWSSMPDDTLLNVAYREDLHDSLVMRREAIRMMKSPKFKRFSSSFAPQWLGIEDITAPSKIDLTKYPSFTESLKEAMIDEVVTHFDFVFNKGNLLQLIHSDFGFVNEELAEHYGISDVRGDHFQRVNWDDERRGGVLGMAAVLTATSLPGRTSPVLRGQWVLNEILGGKVPPPPPDVPELEEAKEKVHDELDLRALLEQHRSPSTCIGCHKKMDGLGFGLENYDAIGKWRDNYTAEVQIDARGDLEDGRSFNGPGELKRVLLSEQNKFAQTFSRKLLSYALGRSIQFLDTPALDNLTNSLIQSNFNGGESIVSLVTSYPFRHRRSDMVHRYLDKAP